MSRLYDIKPITEAEITARVEELKAAEEQPVGVSQVVTPAGIEIYYQAGPKRLYRVRQSALPRPLGGLTHAPDAEWQEVTSVSTYLDVLEKGGLSWWGMKVGISGTLAWAKGDDLEIGAPDLDGPEVAKIVDRLKEHRLTVNHVKSKAADRGTDVHKALELYAETGTLPDPKFYPESQEGYVRGLVSFLLDSNLRVTHSEVMVASLDSDGFAGRFDVVGQVDGNVAVRCYPKKASKYEKVKFSSGIVDLKTSKGVYPSYKIQTAAYAAGFQQCGYGEIDAQYVLRVTADGKYELVESTATYKDFVAVMDAYNAVKRNS
jgi:hypothetical protein